VQNALSLPCVENSVGHHQFETQIGIIGIDSKHRLDSVDAVFDVVPMHMEQLRNRGGAPLITQILEEKLVVVGVMFLIVRLDLFEKLASPGGLYKVLVTFNAAVQHIPDITAVEVEDALFGKRVTLVLHGVQADGHGCLSL
jgi:hypothetical protein